MRDNYFNEFNLTEDQRVNMKYSDANGYSDALHAMRFEGIPTKLNYTEKEGYWIDHTQLFSLVDPYTAKARRLFSSKTLEKPLEDLLELEDVIKGEASEKPVQYKLYSMHDTDIGNLLYSLVPSYNFTWVPYASSIVFEVYRDHHEDKVGHVRCWYNGMQMDIDGCSK